MIVFLREKFIAHIFMWIIAIVFVIGSFLLYTTMSGSSSSGPGDDDVVLKINGAKVRRGEFERLVSNHMQRQQQQGQAGLTIERDQIERQVIDQIIQEQIYLNGAQFSDAEIEEGIRRQFSHLLAAYNASKPQERNYLRQIVRLQMSFEALRSQFEGLDLITDSEIENEYRLQNDKAKLKFIQFQHTSYSSAVTLKTPTSPPILKKTEMIIKSTIGLIYGLSNLIQGILSPTNRFGRTMMNAKESLQRQKRLRRAIFS